MIKRKPTESLSEKTQLNKKLEKMYYSLSEKNSNEPTIAKAMEREEPIEVLKMKYAKGEL